MFANALGASPDVRRLVSDTQLEGQVRGWRDHSYIATDFAGPGYQVAGDAAGFIDPLVSTGVHLAFLGAVSAAASICSELRGDLPSAELERHHHHRHLAQA